MAIKFYLPGSAYRTFYISMRRNRPWGVYARSGHSNFEDSIRDERELWGVLNLGPISLHVNYEWRGARKGGS